MDWTAIFTAMKPILAQGTRDGLRIIGMGLATHGFIQNGAGTEAFIGAGMTLAGLFWGWFTTSGYLKVGALLKKLTAAKTPADAVAAAQILPPAAAVDTVAKSVAAQSVAKIIVAAILLGMFAFTGDARAQGKLTGNLVKDIAAATSRPATATTTAASTDSAIGSFGDSVRKITKELVDKAIADVTAASADAEKHNDLISKPCWDANLKLLQGLPSQWENPPADIGIALGIQIQRDLLNSITGNDTTSLKVACAALWGDQLKIVANVGALIGVRIATGGLF